MIEDAVPEEYVAWAVLVEEETCVGRDDHRWQLTQRHLVKTGGRAAADELARKLAMEHVPAEVYLPSGATAGRRVFRVADGSWLMEVRGGGSPVLCKVTTAEQVHVQPYTATLQEEVAPPAKGRRLFGRS
ncbi:hypothetical protein [Streptomyces narbonensis]|uniref:hypothetical protein n=1 Tax=Streptomyces narbonensis TaxID=67333 RepID=UPI00167A3EF6|nr:hypothetical protein [Streptomyces narbonensis]